VFFERTGIRDPADHKNKYKQGVNCGEKKVGRCRENVRGKGNGVWRV
jgi:hypothetical protein